MTQQSEVRRRLEKIDEYLKLYESDKEFFDSAYMSDVVFLRQQLRELQRVAREYCDIRDFRSKGGVAKREALCLKLEDLK